VQSKLLPTTGNKKDEWKSEFFKIQEACLLLATLPSLKIRGFKLQSR